MSQNLFWDSLITNLYNVYIKQHEEVGRVLTIRNEYLAQGETRRIFASILE